ncbi:putative nuclease HARBI1 [Photinus pyralis]|nr:putative nuclease HARBI1 [Photinus pyralis]XP_031333707.1 putative nuclease HARBI1 [Photinus pyralis]
MSLPNGFPGIIGAIDCTHVAIIAPPHEDPHYPGMVFLNRKGYCSINVQIICNANLRILAINSRFPGSVHDSAIWSTSLIRRHLIAMHDEGNQNSWLIGDSGYPLEPWLLTPVAGINLTDPERRYNMGHKSVRNVIERLNGVLKGRFRCLGRARMLHYSPPVAAKIINSCAVLHNLCVDRGEIDVEEEIDENMGDDIPCDIHNENYGDNNVLIRGRNIRNRVIRNHFMN